MNGSVDVIEKATQTSWEAGIIALMLVGAVATLGYMIKQISSRHSMIEDRILTTGQERERILSGRINELENLIRTELLSMIRQNSETMGKVLTAADSMCRAAEQMTLTLNRFSHILESRPCMFQIKDQAK